MSQGAYAAGINTPPGVDLPIGAGGTGVGGNTVITVTAPTATTPSRVGIFQPAPGYTLDVNGDTNIGGNLFVSGMQSVGNRIFMSVMGRI